MGSSNDLIQRDKLPLGCSRSWGLLLPRDSTARWDLWLGCCW